MSRARSGMVSKGGVSFPPDQPLPAKAVEALVKARLEELGAAPAKARGGKSSCDWLQRMQAVNFFGNLVWGLIAALLYHTVAEGIGGATIGKLLIGHRVVNADLRPAGALAAFMRSLAYFLDSLFFGIPAYSSMSESSLHQRIGDKWASTIVAQAGALPAHARRSGGLIALGIFAGSAAYVACLAISMVARAL